MIFAHPSVVFQSYARLICIRSLDKDQLMFPDLVKNTHVVPRGDNRFHVKVTREECNNTIRNDLAVFNEDAAEVPYNGWVVSDLEPRAYGHLVASTRNHLQRPSESMSALPPARRLLTRGKNEFRVSVMAYVSWTTGVNCSILGYISSGEIVPDVITTLLNLSKTGAMASDGSRQLHA